MSMAARIEWAPTMTAPDDKGRELERAVQAIGAVILKSSPALREQPFKIEARKRVNVGGVHHEIDIFVTVEAAKGYTSIFIFECKNWEAAVGKKRDHCVLGKDRRR